ERMFGEDYAKTLATWRNNFREACPNLKPLGFDDRFRRVWEYYLSYCEAGILSGNIDVRQVVFAKSGQHPRVPVGLCPRRRASRVPRADETTGDFKNTTINND